MTRVTRETEPRQTGDAAELDAAERFCSCCGRELRGRVAWLELDRRLDAYHDRGDVPEAHSQGWFPFGLDCARRLVREAPPSPTMPTISSQGDHS